MQVSTAIILYLVGASIIAMPEVFEVTLRLLSAPFICVRSALDQTCNSDPAPPTMRFFAAKTLAFISGNHPLQAIKVFNGYGRPQARIQVRQGRECGLAIAFASLGLGLYVQSSVFSPASPATASSVLPPLEGRSAGEPRQRRAQRPTR
ncbi:hypothetical protein MTO96_046394, partial [Rhipicephalus appendiculatus]